MAMKKAGAGAYVEVREKILEEGSSCVLRHITRTSRAVVSLWDRALKPSGLTGNQFHILSVLVASGEMNIKNLSRIVGMDATTVTRAIQPLIREGVLQTKVGVDARQRILHITARGRKQFQKALPLWEQVQKNVVNHFGNHEWADMMTGLGKVRESVRHADKSN
jgi:DNA-binding MarR family transcriptional regulator